MGYNLTARKLENSIIENIDIWKTTLLTQIT